MAGGTMKYAAQQGADVETKLITAQDESFAYAQIAIPTRIKRSQDILKANGIDVSQTFRKPGNELIADINSVLEGEINSENENEEVDFGRVIGELQKGSSEHFAEETVIPLCDDPLVYLVPELDENDSLPENYADWRYRIYRVESLEISEG